MYGCRSKSLTDLSLECLYPIYLSSSEYLMISINNQAQWPADQWEAFVVGEAQNPWGWEGEGDTEGTAANVSNHSINQSNKVSRSS